MMHLVVNIAWGQVSMDYNDDEEQWFNATENLQDLICNCPFDEHVNCTHTNKVETNIQHLK